MMSPQSVVLVVVLLLPGLWSCAPDAVTSRQATGYNAFLDQIARECKPLQVGRYQMSEMIQRNAMVDDYVYFIDQTSRLYYGTISEAAYRSSINGFFEGGSTGVAIDCILSKLPPNR
jgi:hypothetical protein